jgi:hypothetical protein
MSEKERGPYLLIEAHGEQAGENWHVDRLCTRDMRRVNRFELDLIRFHEGVFQWFDVSMERWVRA